MLVTFDYSSDMEQPSLSIRFYFKMCTFIGLNNIHYDKRRRRAVLRHTPTVVYTLILDVIYFLLAPSAFGLLVQTMYRCQVIGMLPLVFNVVSLAKLASIMLLLCSIWLRRARLQRLSNSFLLLLDNYRLGIKKYCQWRCILKMIMTSSRFYLVVVQLLGPGTAGRCGKSGVTNFPRYYLAAVGFSMLMELLLSCTDFMGYIFVVIANFVLVCMADEVNDLILDHKRLQSSNGCIHKMYESQILAGWRAFWHRVRCLNRLLGQILDICQWQVLFNLFTSYLSDIAIMFRMLIYAEYETDFSYWRLIFYVIICLVHHTDIMMRFHILEENHSRWQHLLQRLGQLYSVAQPERDLILSRQVEFAILRLGRQLQPYRHGVRSKDVAGMFDLNNASAYSMTSSMAINVIILFQIAYKNYS